MPRFSANLTLLYGEHDFLDRFAAAAADGFEGVECQSPYEHEAEAIAERLETNKLRQVLHNLPVGDWAAGERGIACLPGREGEFQDSVGVAIDYAKTLGCRQVNCLAGIAPSGAEAAELEEILVGNLTFAAAALKESGIRLLIEAVNTRDTPGFFLNGSAQAAAIRERVGSDNLFLQHDFYHMQIMEGDLARTIQRYGRYFGHYHTAGNPGRYNLDQEQEINYGFVCRTIANTGYEGYVGHEFEPKGDLLDALREAFEACDQGS